MKTIKIIFSIILSILLIIGAVLHINNEYTIPKSPNVLLEEDEVKKKNNKNRRK